MQNATNIIENDSIIGCTEKEDDIQGDYMLSVYIGDW